MRPQTYEITFVSQAGVMLCAEFDACAITQARVRRAK